MDKIYFIIFILSLLLASSCTSSRKFTSVKSSKANSVSLKNKSKAELVGKVLYGKASYYADKFHGRTTANGEKFDMNDLTAAHKELPFGTVIKVTNLKNNKSVVVRINDRGPYVGKRILDLSKAAAEEIDMIRDGVVEVKIEILE